MNIAEYCPLQYIILHSQAHAIWCTARDNIHQYSCNNKVTKQNTISLFINKATKQSQSYGKSKNNLELIN